MSGNISGWYSAYYSDGLLDYEFSVSYLYNDNSSHRHQGAYNIQEGGRSPIKSGWRHIPDNQQDRECRWTDRNYFIRYIHADSEQSQFLNVPWNIQTAYREILGCDIHEMDILVRVGSCCTIHSQRACNIGLDINPANSVCRTGIPYCLCYFHNLFPDSGRSEAHQTNPCKHVQLCPADYCHSHQHMDRHGHSHMAESSCSDHGLRRCSHR